MTTQPRTRISTLLGGVLAALLAVSTALPAHAETRHPAAVSTATVSLGAELQPGQSLLFDQMLESPNGQHGLYLGRYLVIGGPSGFFSELPWEPSDSEAKRLVMQSDGNLVGYDGAAPQWWTGTDGNPGAKVALQSDGNLVVYSATGRALWASGQADNSEAYSWEDSESAELRSEWMLHSPNGRYKLVMQPDGNFVLYSPRRATWSSGSAGNSGARFVLQSDGNLVVYSSAGAVKWTSRTSRGNQPGLYRLAVQNDGNVVVYYGPSIYDAPNRVLWQTRTAGVS